MNLQRFQPIVIIAVSVLLLTACGWGKDGHKDPPAEPGASVAKQETSFSFRFNSHALGGTAGTLAVQPLASVLIEGTLLVVRDGESPEQGEEYAVSLQVDSAAHEITTNIRLGLEANAYDVYFLLETPSQQHAGISLNRLIVSGGLNTITVALNPVLGGHVTSVRDLARLSAFKVRYDPEVLASYGRPRIGLGVDGGAEQVFDVLLNAKDPVIVLFLSSGPHQIAVRFYDGAEVTMVPADPSPVDVAPPGETPTEIPLVPITAEAQYNYTPTTPESTAGVGVFTFTVPLDVVAEASSTGSISNLKAVASLVGPENVLVEQELVLEPVTDPSTGAILHYVGTFTLAPFVPGAITWQLSFVDRTTGEEFSYCAQSVDTTSTTTPNTGSFLCYLHLLVRAQIAAAPMGTLAVTVGDVYGLVPGAVVMLDGNPLGITGSGTAGEALGTLTAFLAPGNHILQVVQKIVDPFGSGQILERASAPQTVTLPGSLLTLAVTLPDFPFDAPEVTGKVPADGATNVAVDTTIAVTYSHRMNPASAQAGFSISPAVAGTFEWSAGDTVLTFKPNAYLAYLTLYTITIDPATQDVVGAQINSGSSFAFTTGTQPDRQAPSVNGVAPSMGEGNVDVARSISITFSEPMDTLATGQAFQLTPSIAGELSWSGGNTVLQFQPTGGLQYSTLYTVRLLNGARDPAGNALAGTFASTFTTGVAPDMVPPHVLMMTPGDKDENVPLDVLIQVEFDEAMDTASVENAFSVQPEVPGSFGWSADFKTVTFTPTANTLEYDTWYRVRVGTTAKDASRRNGLEVVAESSFRTVLPPVSEAVYIDIEAARKVRPRRYVDGLVDITEPTTVRIPRLEDLKIAQDVDGNLLGDPDQFLVFLNLGKVKCMYLAGKWDRHVGGVAEEYFKHAFQSPVCNKGGHEREGQGHRRAGQLVTITPKEARSTTASSDGRDAAGHRDNDDDHFPDNDAEIKMRVVTGSPHFAETRVKVRIEVVTP